MNLFEVTRIEVLLFFVSVCLGTTLLSSLTCEVLPGCTALGCPLYDFSLTSLMFGLRPYP